MTHSNPVHQRVNSLSSLFFRVSGCPPCASCREGEAQHGVLQKEKATVSTSTWNRPTRDSQPVGITSGSNGFASASQPVPVLPTIPMTSRRTLTTAASRSDRPGAHFRLEDDLDEGDEDDDLDDDEFDDEDEWDDDEDDEWDDDDELDDDEEE